MLYALSGSHRCGKSTLAKGLAESCGLTYVPIKTTEVALKHGYNPVAPMTLETRIGLQVILLDEYMSTIAGCPRPAIVDRSPLDHLAYLLAEIHMQSHNEVPHLMIEKLMKLIEATTSTLSHHIDMVIYLHPLPTYEVDPTKPAPNRLYQYHYASVLRGMIAVEGHKFNWADVPMADHAQRLEFCSSMIGQRIAQIEHLKAHSPHLH